MNRALVRLRGQLIVLIIFTFLACIIAACVNDADVASRNLSVEADQFKIMRRIVFYNGITDTYMLTIEGACSLGNNDGPKELTVTCKTGPEGYKKHFLGLSDNVTYFVEQLDSVRVNTYHYKVIFKPEAIIPDIDFSYSGQDKQ